MRSERERELKVSKRRGLRTINPLAFVFSSCTPLLLFRFAPQPTFINSWSWKKIFIFFHPSNIHSIYSFFKRSLVSWKGSDVLVSCLWCALGRFGCGWRDWKKNLERDEKKSPFTARKEKKFSSSKCNFSAQQFSSVSATHVKALLKGRKRLVSRMYN